MNQVSRAPINLGYSRSFPTTLPRTRTLSTYVHPLDLLSTKAQPHLNFTIRPWFLSFRLAVRIFVQGESSTMRVSFNGHPHSFSFYFEGWLTLIIAAIVCLCQSDDRRLKKKYCCTSCPTLLLYGRK